MSAPQKLFDKFPKAAIEPLPRLAFGGRIIVIETVQEASRAIRALRRSAMVGIDTETKPTFSAGNHHRVALLQVSTERTAYLFRLCKTGVTPDIRLFLEDQNQLKVGLSLKDDWHQLRERGTFTPGRTLDLQQFVERFGIEDRSLQKLCANVLGRRLSKREQLSNWEAPTLSPKQMIYAATDAWACLKLYRRLTHLWQTGAWQPVSSVDQDVLCSKLIIQLLHE